MCDCCDDICECNCECDCDICDGMTDTGKGACIIGSTLCSILSLLIMILFPISVTVLEPVTQPSFHQTPSSITESIMIPIASPTTKANSGPQAGTGSGSDTPSSSFPGISKWSFSRTQSFEKSKTSPDRISEKLPTSIPQSKPELSI